MNPGVGKYAGVTGVIVDAMLREFVHRGRLSFGQVVVSAVYARSRTGH
tara:strand:- start:4554 stop:4697 length:144 start_codon:yes stop_codon:yes gene_type:complete